MSKSAACSWQSAQQLAPSGPVTALLLLLLLLLMHQ
jgi:hypothetical protein